jgi:hypothetical protein
MAAFFLAAGPFIGYFTFKVDQTWIVQFDYMFGTATFDGREWQFDLIK